MALHAQSWPQGPSGRSSHGFGSEGEYLVRSGLCRSAAVRDLASPAMPWYRPRNDEGTAKRNARPSLRVTDLCLGNLLLAASDGIGDLVGEFAVFDFSVWLECVVHDCSNESRVTGAYVATTRLTSPRGAPPAKAPTAPADTRQLASSRRTRGGLSQPARPRHRG